QLASTHGNLGEVRRRIGKLAEAEADCRKAIRLLEQLEVDPRTGTDVPLTRARAFMSLAHMLADTQRAEEAVAAFRRAQGELEEPVARFPKMPVYRSLLGSTLNNLAVILTELGQAGDARPLAEEAIRHFTIVLKINPRDPEDAKSLYDAYKALMVALFR